MFHSGNSCHPGRLQPLQKWVVSRDLDFKADVKQGGFTSDCTRTGNTVGLGAASGGVLSGVEGGCTQSPPSVVPCTATASAELGAACLLASALSWRCVPAFGAPSHTACLLAHLPVTGKMIKGSAAV